VIGGAGVSRGYLHAPALTAAAFVPDPFADQPGSRMYRSGDRGRRRRDGQLVFIGRDDDQIKIRGHRIELGDLEYTLRHHPAVADAAAMVRTRPDGLPELVAIVVPRAGQIITDAELRSFLAQRLPAPMVPAQFSIAERVPRLLSGKIDRAALQSVSLTPLGAAASVALTTDVEIKLAELWRSLLPVDAVGADADFFRLGGHSMLATRLVTAIRGAFGVSLPLSVVFEKPLLSDMALEIEVLVLGALTSADVERLLHRAESPS
jgi:hypothetical protein